MKVNRSLFYHILVRVVFPVIGVLFLLEIVHYINTKRRYAEANELKNKIIYNEIKAFQEFQDMALEILEESMDEKMRKYSKTLVEKYFANYENINKADLNFIRQDVGMDHLHEDLYIINSDGIVINTTYKKDLHLNFFDFGVEHEEYLMEILHGDKFVSEDFAIEKSTRRPRKYSYQPTKDHNYIIEIGVYSQKADELINFIYENLNSLSKIDASIKKVNLFVGADKPFSLFRGTVIDQKQYAILQEVNRIEDPYERYVDDKDPNIVIEYMYIPKKNSQLYKGSVIQIISDMTVENNYMKRELVKSIILGITVSLILVVLVLFRIDMDITRPIRQIRDILRNLSEGDLKSIEELKVKTGYEIKQIADNVDGIISRTNEIISYNNMLATGNWDNTLEPKSDRDQIADSFRNLQGELKRFEKEAQIRKLEEEHHNWTSNGINRFSEILRESPDVVVDLANSILKNLVQYMKAIQGGFFLYNDDDKNNLHLELVATFAYNKFRHSQNRIGIGEGLIGMCALERFTIYRTEIPEEYMTIDSGLGTANPTSLLIVPIKLEQELYGVIEIASFDTLADYEIEFVEKIAESVSYTLSRLKINRRTTELLKQSQKQSEEFESKELDLRAQIRALMQENEKLNQKLTRMDNIFERLQKAYPNEPMFFTLQQ